MSDMEETGAIDWLLVEAKGKEINGELVPPLLDLVDRRLIRILDVAVLVKRGEGDFDALSTDDLDPAQVGDIGALAGRRPGCGPRRCRCRRGRDDAEQPWPPDMLNASSSHFDPEATRAFFWDTGFRAKNAPAQGAKNIG